MFAAARQRIRPPRGAQKRKLRQKRRIKAVTASLAAALHEELVASLSPLQLQRLEAEFKELDKENDGVIRVREIMTVRARGGALLTHTHERLIFARLCVCPCACFCLSVCVCVCVCVHVCVRARCAAHTHTRNARFMRLCPLQFIGRLQDTPPSREEIVELVSAIDMDGV